MTQTWCTSSTPTLALHQLLHHHCLNYRNYRKLTHAFAHFLELEAFEVFEE